MNTYHAGGLGTMVRNWVIGEVGRVVFHGLYEGRWYLHVSRGGLCQLWPLLECELADEIVGAA